MVHGVSKLVMASVAPATLSRYTKEYVAFFAWADGSVREVSSWSDLDGVMVDYLDELFELNQGRGRSAAGNLVSAVNLFFPGAKGCLPACGKLLKGWARLRPSAAWPPISRGLNRLVAFWLFKAGFPWHGMAVLLGFSCLLRISEVLQVVAQDIVFKGDAVLPAGFKHEALIRLGKAKTGEEQSVVISELWVASLLKVMVGKWPKGRLFAFSSAELRTKFGQAVEAWGFGSVGYVFHSNRHGRATEEDLLGTPLEDILRMGRWAAARSGRHYIQSGAAMLAKHRLTGGSLRGLKVLEKDFLGHFLACLC